MIFNFLCKTVFSSKNRNSMLDNKVDLFLDTC